MSEFIDYRGFTLEKKVHRVQTDQTGIETFTRWSVLAPEPGTSAKRILKSNIASEAAARSYVDDLHNKPK